MQPVVVLVGENLPQSLKDKGGWTNADMPEWFKEYARYCFSAFGDRVRSTELYVLEILSVDKNFTFQT